MTKDELLVFRTNLWKDTWLLIAGDMTTKTTNIPKAWADRAVDFFDEKFPELTSKLDPEP